MRSALSKADGTDGWESSLLPSDSFAVSAEYPFQTAQHTGRGRCLCADEAFFSARLREREVFLQNGRILRQKETCI